MEWRRKDLTVPPDRSTGSSTHTAVELYLDMAVAHERAAARGSHPTEFLFVVPTTTLGHHFQGELRRIHRVLQCATDPEKLSFLTTEPNATERLRGSTWYSWAIFCDHTVKDEVIPWPCNRIRSLHEEEAEEDSWAARDRDGVLLMHLSESGKTDLLRRATCPISVVPSWLDAPACYPAWTHPHLRVRLFESFKI